MEKRLEARVTMLRLGCRHKPAGGCHNATWQEIGILDGAGKTTTERAGRNTYGYRKEKYLLEWAWRRKVLKNKNKKGRDGGCLGVSGWECSRLGCGRKPAGGRRCPVCSAGPKPCTCSSSSFTVQRDATRAHGAPAPFRDQIRKLPASGCRGSAQTPSCHKWRRRPKELCVHLCAEPSVRVLLHRHVVARQPGAARHLERAHH